MFRVRGNKINASDFARPNEHPCLTVIREAFEESERILKDSQVQVLGRPARDGSRKLKTTVDRGKFYKLEQSLNKAYYVQLKRALDQRPKIRTRKTGPVGPDLDWSVIYSDVPVTIFHDPKLKFGSDYFGAQDPKEEGRAIFPYDSYRSRLNAATSFHFSGSKERCVETHAMGPEEVRLWTQWAYRNGIHFSGERGYVRTSSSHAWTTDMAVNAFRELKARGALRSHIRTPEARIRRAARRGARDALIGTVPAERLFVTRYSLSSKQIRENWFRLDPRPSFKAYKESLDKNITLFPRRCRATIPGIVFKALKRLYEKPVKVSGNYWFKPVEDLRYVLKVPQPPKRGAYYRPRETRAGSLVFSHIDNEDYGDILSSTIPRVTRDSNSSAWVDWARDPDDMGRYFGKAKRRPPSPDDDNPFSKW